MMTGTSENFIFGLTKQTDFNKDKKLTNVTHSRQLKKNPQFLPTEDDITVYLHFNVFYSPL